MPLTPRLNRLLEEISLLPDPHEKLQLLVDRARRAPPLPSAEKTSANRVPGCVSVVWLVGRMEDGLCHFHADAESPVVRALLVLLTEFFSGLPPTAIVANQVDPLDAIGVTANLTPTRRNGLRAAVESIRAFARRQLRPEASTD